MITAKERRLENLALNRVAFFRELPALLNMSDAYVRQLVCPAHGETGDRHRSLKFPKPFFTTRSGVRIWWVKDLESWASDVRRYRRSAAGNRIGSTLLERRDVADELLGRH